MKEQPVEKLSENVEINEGRLRGELYQDRRKGERR